MSSWTLVLVTAWDSSKLEGRWVKLAFCFKGTGLLDTCFAQHVEEIKKKKKKKINKQKIKDYQKKKKKACF